MLKNLKKQKKKIKNHQKITKTKTKCKKPTKKS